MIPINNSDTAWLIVADYNQDNDIGFPESLREDVLEPDVVYFDDDCGTNNDKEAYGQLVGSQSYGVGSRYELSSYVGDRHAKGFTVGTANTPSINIGDLYKFACKK